MINFLPDEVAFIQSCWFISRTSKHSPDVQIDNFQSNVQPNNRFPGQTQFAGFLCQPGLAV